MSGEKSVVIGNNRSSMAAYCPVSRRGKLIVSVIGLLTSYHKSIVVAISAETVEKP